jgi:hypothetical protein
MVTLNLRSARKAALVGLLLAGLKGSVARADEPEAAQGASVIVDRQSLAGAPSITRLLATPACP